MSKAALNTFVESPANCETAALWERYKATGDIRLRNKLVLLHMRLVEIIARKMYHVFTGKAQLEDIISNGTIALIKAVESYDPTMNVKFDTYASIRIRGSVIDYIRSQDWVPRTVRIKAKKIDESYERLKTSLGREPDYEEIARDLGVSRQEVEAILSEAYDFNMISVEELIRNNLEDVDNIGPSPQELVVKKELAEKLGRAIDSLSEKERTVVTLFYYEELKVKDIARVMGISSSRVCQIHSMALVRIKKALGSYMNA